MTKTRLQERYNEIDERHGVRHIDEDEDQAELDEAVKQAALDEGAETVVVTINETTRALPPTKRLTPAEIAAAIRRALDIIDEKHGLTKR